MKELWLTLFFEPIYNCLVFFIDIVRNHDVGIAVIATVVFVKVLLLPLSIRVAKMQKTMREIEPRLRETKEKFKDDREKQALALMEVYREAKLNPFSSIFLIFIQIPIIFALYFSVYSGGGIKLPEINVDILYSFVSIPTEVNMFFLNLVDISGKSLLLAILAGLAQYLQVKMILPPLQPRDPSKEPDFKDELVANMQMSMRYFMPVLIAIISYTLSAIIALYFLVSSLMAIAQEMYIKKKKIR